MTATTTDPTLLHVKPSDIAHHPVNPRREVGDVSDIVESAKSIGILEPLIVACWPEDLDGTAAAKRKHLLIAGHRRLEGAKQARLKAVPVILREDLDTVSKQLEVMLIENLHRSNLTPIEEGNGYQTLIELGDLTQSQVAAHLGQSRGRVRDRIKLTKLPAGVQDRVHTGQIALTDAIEASAFAGDPVAMQRLEDAAGTNNFAFELERAKRERKAEQDWRSLVKQIREAGYTELDQFDIGAARTVSQLPNLFYVTWDRGEAWAGEKRLHGDCPHRAVVIVEHGGQVSQNMVRFYCTKPEVHEPEGTSRDTSLPETPDQRAALEAEQAERTAREQARLELQTRLDAAATVRREHVAQILHHKTGDEDLAKRLLLSFHRAEWVEGNVSGCTSDYVWPVIAGWLRLDPQLGLPGRSDAVLEKLDKLTLPALAMLARITWFAQSELALTNASNVRFPGDEDDTEWFRLLADEFAYQWSDFEREHFGLDADGHVPAPVDQDDESGVES